MVKFTHLYKKSTHVGKRFLLLTSFSVISLLPTPSLIKSHILQTPLAKAATVAPTLGGSTLAPATYDTYDTGSHDYGNGTDYVRKASNWKTSGSATVNNNWFSLTPASQNKAGYSIFNGALDMTRNASISGWFRTNLTTTLGGANFINAGDAIGFILTPQSQQEINANYDKNANPPAFKRPVYYPVGSGIGIGGLTSSVFAVRDLYQNQTYATVLFDLLYDVDGTYHLLDNPAGASNRISIRTTRNADGTAMISGLGPNGQLADTGQDKNAGNLLPGTGAGEGAGDATNLPGWNYPTAHYPGNPHTLSNLDLLGTVSQEDEQMTLNWTYGSTSSDGRSVTGTLALSVQSYIYSGGSSDPTTPTGSKVTISQQTITVPKTMSVGVIGATGNNYGALSFYNNTSVITGNRGQRNVRVNYVNAITKKKMASLTSSTIIANIGDRIAIGAPGTSSASSNGLPGKYTFVAPSAPSAYSYSQVTFGGSFDATSGVLTGDVASSKDPNDSSNTTGGLTVANYDPNSNNNPNQINIYYTPSSVKGSLYQAFEQGTPGSTTLSIGSLATLGNDFLNFPTALGWGGTSKVAGTVLAGTAASSVITASGTQNLTGFVESGIPYPERLTIPVGYTIGHIYYQTASGSWQTYTAAVGTDGSALYAQLKTEHPNFNMLYNSVVVTFQPVTWTATFAQKFADNTPGINGNDGKSPIKWIQNPITALQGSPFIGRTGGSNIPTYTAQSGFTYQISSTDGTNTYTDSSLASAVAHWSLFNSNTAFTINVPAQTQTGTVKALYVKDTPGTDATGKPSNSPTTPGKTAPLPNEISFSGLTNAPVRVPSLTLYNGYAVDHVVAPDGKKYDTVEQAQNSENDENNGKEVNRYFNTTSNDWTIYLKAVTQKPTLTAHFTSSVGKVIPSDITIPFQDAEGKIFTGVTGSVIPSEIARTTEAKLTTMMSGATYADWVAGGYTDPPGNLYPASQNFSGVVTAVGGVLFAEGNNYIKRFDYSGTLSMMAPSKIDFGSHQINGQSQKLTGNLSAGLVVTDNRSEKLTAWEISVAQTEDIHDVNQLTGNNFSFAGMLSYKNTILNSTPVSIYTKTTPRAGEVITVVAADSADFKLEAPLIAQNPLAQYQGEITWTMTVAQ